MVTIDKAEQEKSELIARYIERNPNKPAVYDARLNPYGVSIWAIASHFETVNGSDLDRAAAEYGVPREAIEAALAFYERYKAAIDAKIEGMRALSEGWDDKNPWGDSMEETRHGHELEMNDERFAQLRRDPRVHHASEEVGTSLRAVRPCRGPS